MSRKTMLKNEKNKSIRVINKAFDKYPIEQQELMKQESTLIIYRSVKNKKFDSYADYMDFFKALTPEERTIIFCGIPIKLSKKQFAILSLLIREQKFYASEYAELEFKKKDKIKDKDKTKENGEDTDKEDADQDDPDKEDSDHGDASEDQDHDDTSSKAENKTSSDRETRKKDSRSSARKSSARNSKLFLKTDQVQIPDHRSLLRR